MRSLLARLWALTLGLVVTLLALELLVRGVGGYAHWAQLRRNQLLQGAELRILALGESTTQVGGPISWPAQLEKLLKAGMPTSKVAVYNGAAPGVNSSYLVDHIDEQLALYHPQIVIAMMGANDDGDFIPLTSVDATPLPAWLASVRLVRFGCYVRAQLFPPPPRPAQLERYEPPTELRSQDYDPILARPMHRDYELAERAFGSGQQELAIALLERAIRAAPDDPRPYLHLAELYQLKTSTLERALPLLRKVCAMYPHAAFGYVALGRALSNCSRQPEADQAMQQAVGKDYVFLGRTPQLARRFVDFLQRAGYDDEAERFFRCQERNVFYPDVVGVAYAHWMARKRLDKAAPYKRELERLRTTYFVERTRGNYMRLYDKLRRNHVRLVCAQYANRSPQPLAHFFADRSDVQVISNLEPFRSYTDQGRFDELFMDKCNGDMGHCTPLGNYYIAFNIARALLAAGLGDPARLVNVQTY
jgi:tetratricopeptide (TPR) repeat protein